MFLIRNLVSNSEQPWRDVRKEVPINDDEIFIAERHKAVDPITRVNHE